jgi:hypothetical protein
MRMGDFGMFTLLIGLQKELGAQGTAPSAINMYSLEMLQIIINSTKFNRVTRIATGGS